MFISKRRLRRLESELAGARSDYERLNDRLWVLRQEFELALAHLGLSVKAVPFRREIRTKGGPEKG